MEDRGILNRRHSLRDGTLSSSETRPCHTTEELENRRCQTASHLDLSIERPISVSFILIPRFSLIAASSAIETLRLANRISGRDLYRWETITLDSNPVLSSSGVPFWCPRSFEDPSLADLAFVCAGTDAHLFRSSRLSSWLRRHERNGGTLGSLCTGAIFLARAGLLNGYRCTVHWANRAALSEEFPDIVVSDRLFEIDRNRITCGGGTSPIDMMLSLVEARHGDRLAAAIADHMVHERIRHQTEPQKIPLVARLGIPNVGLARALSAMESNLETPLSRPALAQYAGLSERQVERLFRTHIGKSPMAHYLCLRLQHARRLITQSTLSISEVGLASGFISPSHFTKCYRDLFGITPREDRSKRKLE